MHSNGFTCVSATQWFRQQLRFGESRHSLFASHSAIGSDPSMQEVPLQVVATHSPSEHFPRRPSAVQSASTLHWSLSGGMSNEQLPK